MNRIEPKETLSLEEYILALPQCLADVLDMGMNGIDYHRLNKTDIAIAMRCLAAIVSSLEERLMEELT